MRGKLRDKRAGKKDNYTVREGVERRQPYKRGTQTVNWQSQDIDDEEYDGEFDEEEEVEYEVADNVEVKPIPQQQKK